MASSSGGLLKVRVVRGKGFLEWEERRLEAAPTRPEAGVAMRMRRSWPCLARPPSGVSKMRLCS